MKDHPVLGSIWFKLYLGEQWTEDDGAQKENIHAKNEARITFFGDVSGVQNQKGMREELVRLFSVCLDNLIDTHVRT